VLLGFAWFQLPEPDTVPLAGSCAKPRTGQLTTCTPGQTLVWCGPKISNPTDPHGPACRVVAVGPGAAPA